MPIAPDDTNLAFSISITFELIALGTNQLGKRLLILP
jgi:hypothetical protein